MRALIQKLDRKLFFPFLPEAETEKYYLVHQTIRYDYQPGTLQHSPPALQAYFEACTKGWTMEQFHFHYPQPCIIEPTLGYAITRGNHLIPQSLWNTYVHRHKPMFLKYALTKRQKIQLKTAIPLHYAWGNYWHFYNDIIGSIALADAAGLPRDTPILIAEGLPKMRFFQQILELSPELQQRNWVLQSSHTNAHCDEAHFFNTYWDHRKNFDAVLDFIDFKNKLRVEPAGQRRIFIGRKANRGRNILNMEEVGAIIAQYGFEYVECDELSVRQQLDLFQHAAYVIGIHGAGLTNIIFRQDRPLKVLEIFSADYWNPCYYWLCVQYGFSYYSQVGSATGQAGTSTGNFTLDPTELERQIVAMLSE